MRIWMRACALVVAGLVCFAAPVSAATPDGAHDFDFDIGAWTLHMKRLWHPLTGSTTWYEMKGTATSEVIWGGRANIAEVEADGPHGHLELLALRIYDPQSHQWSISFTNNAASGQLSVPCVGEFRNGRGVFIDQEAFNGRMILVRFTIWASGPNSIHSEQAFSADNGKTWETNLINDFTRTGDAPAPDDRPAAANPLPGDAAHDFDFNFGKWNAHIKALHRASDNTTSWKTFDGTADVQKVWDGRAQLEEIEADGSSGHLEALVIILYNPDAHQWTKSFASSDDGQLSTMTGGFANGRGELYSQEMFHGRTQLLRAVWSDITPKSQNFQESSSDDGGRTWQPYFAATFDRM
jgi:hypothetical protein